MLNADKLDVMLTGTSAQLRAAVAVNKSLGVNLDSRLTFAARVTAVCKACNYHIWALRLTRLTHDVANTLACSTVGHALTSSAVTSLAACRISGDLKAGRSYVQRAIHGVTVVLKQSHL